MNDQKLTICMIVKNADKYLTGSLTSVQDIADEIIVVDTGSTDATKAIAHQFTTEVFDFSWCNDFSQARNFSLEKATGDWILVLDGDEELAPQSQDPLRQKLQSNDTEGYLIKVLNHYESGREVLLAPDVVFRLFKNKKEYRYTGKIHEQLCDNILAVNPSAKIEIAEDITLIHYGYLQSEISEKNKAVRNTSLLEESIKTNPENLLDHFHLGVEYFRTNQLNKALDRFLYVVARVNLQAIYTPKLMRYIATCRFLLGQYSEALLFIDEVWLPAFRNHGDAFYLRGNILQNMGNFADSYLSFKQCLLLPPQPAHYANLYCQYPYKIKLQLGNIADYYKDKETALQYFVEVLKELPNCIEALSKIIRILNPQKHPDYTMTALNKIFDLTEPSVQVDLANIFFQQGAYQLAIQVFNSLKDTHTATPSLRLVKGLSLMRTKQFLPAIRELNEIMPTDDFYQTAQSNLLLCYWIQGHSKKAASCWRNLKKLKTNPTLVEVLDNLRNGRTMDHRHVKTDLTQILLIVSEIVARLIELQETAKLREAWACFAGLFNTHPAKLLGDLYFKYQNYTAAEQEYTTLLTQKIVDSETFYKLGKTYWALNNLNQAEFYMIKAYNQGHRSPQVALELARLYQELAAHTLEEGIGNYPDHLELLDLKNKMCADLIEV